MAHRQVQFFAEKVKPDLEAELRALQQEGASLAEGANAITVKDVRALLKAFLTTTETRISVRANESMSRRPQKHVKKTTTVEASET